MKYRIQHTFTAEEDLSSILNYITVKLKNPKAAEDLLDRYKEKRETLRESPRLYGLSLDPKLAQRGYRHFTFGSYIAYYTISEETHTINIIRIFYQKQNYPETL